MITTTAFDAAKTSAFKSVIPDRTKPYADAILKATRETGISPFILVAVMEAETRSGTAPGYYPQGPAGAGDYLARSGRWLDSPVVKQVSTLPPRWSTRKDYPSPPYAIPRDELGWGRGLFQLDMGSHAAFIAGGGWKDPYLAAKYVAMGILLPYRKTLMDAGVKEPLLTEATIAAYNAGPGNVLKAIAAGKPPSSATFHPGYVSEVSGTASALAQRFVGATSGAA